MEASYLLIAAATLVVLVLLILVIGSATRRSSPARDPIYVSSSGGVSKINALERAMHGYFGKKLVFNASERKVFRLLIEETAFARDRLHVLGQVSLREFLETDSKYRRGGSFYSIIDRRVDFAVIDMAGNVQFAVEYHGSGHEQGNWRERDAIKAIALEKAGIPLLIIKKGDAPAKVRELIREHTGLASEEVDPPRGPHP